MILCRFCVGYPYLLVWEENHYHQRNDMNESSNQECAAIGNTLTKNEPLLSNDTTPKKLVGIYGLQNKLKPEKWNVGQSAVDICKRWNRYKHLRCRAQPKVYNALLKYGYDGFEKIILEVCPKEIIEKNEIQKWLDEREDYWITKFNCVENGYNCKGGGAHGKNSKEMNAKISASLKGKKKPPVSDEHRKNLSIAAKGKRKSEEHRKNISIAGKRRPPVSDETRRKLSVASKGKKLPPFSDEHRNNLSMSKKGKKTGKDNPNFGKHWVTNGTESKMVDKTLPILYGWKKGRAYKKKQAKKLQESLVVDKSFGVV